MEICRLRRRRYDLSRRKLPRQRFHLLVLTLAAVLRFSFGFLVIRPTTSTPPLCETTLFRGLPYVSGRYHCKRDSAIFGFPMAIPVRNKVSILILRAGVGALITEFHEKRVSLVDNTQCRIAQVIEEPVVGLGDRCFAGS